jgi:hypothetical protein
VKTHNWPCLMRRSSVVTPCTRFRGTENATLAPEAGVSLIFLLPLVTRLLGLGLLAEYHCRYNWRTRKVTEIRDGVFYPTRFASPQGLLIPLTPQESLILYRPTSPRRPAGERVARQLLLFELVRPASSESA